MLGSVSSFAYQGTNCHAILAAACRMPLARPQPWVWQRTSLWFQITSHPLLQQARWGSRMMAPAVSAAASVQVQCSLGQPALAYLMDHSVQGRVAAPNSLLLELAAAAGQLLSPHDQTHSSVAVTAAAFQQPLLLATPSQGIVECSVQLGSGAVRLSSPAEPGRAAAAVHATAQLQTIEAANQQADQQRRSSAAAAGTFAAQCSVPSSTSALLGSRTSAGLSSIGTGGSSSAAFAAILTDQHHHTGYWIHPAVADASLHLAAALRAQAAGSVTAPRVSAAVGVYAPLQHLAACVAHAAAVAGLGSQTSSHGLSSGCSQLLTIIDHLFKTMAAVEGLGAAAVTAFPVASASDQPPSFQLGLRATSTAAALAINPSAIRERLAEVVASVLGRSDVPADQPLMEAGLDSIGEGGRAAAFVDAVSSALRGILLCCVGLISLVTPQTKCLLCKSCRRLCGAAERHQCSVWYRAACHYYFRLPQH